MAFKRERDHVAWRPLADVRLGLAIAVALSGVVPARGDALGPTTSVAGRSLEALDLGAFRVSEADRQRAAPPEAGRASRRPGNDGRARLQLRPTSPGRQRRESGRADRRRSVDRLPGPGLAPWREGRIEACLPRPGRRRPRLVHRRGPRGIRGRRARRRPGPGPRPRGREAGKRGEDRPAAFASAPRPLAGRGVLSSSARTLPRRSSARSVDRGSSNGT